MSKIFVLEIIVIIENEFDGFLEKVEKIDSSFIVFLRTYVTDHNYEFIEIDF